MGREIMVRQTKITFIGDLMCLKEQNEMIIKKYKQYYYDDVFKLVKRFFEESDYVVGNLETPVAGSEMKYTYQPMSFNAPEAFLHAIKSAGVHFVSMANNHCLDSIRVFMFYLWYKLRI
jgi:poly-gamma-glutamate synthesis protein (capsule biosynthesis protein)